MARKARVLSPINSYTILLKAYDDVSFSNHDLTMFLDTVSKYSNTLNYKFLAYDLNEKVLTFVFYDCDTALYTIMRKICVSFVSRFNLFNLRSGKVFKDRFLSVPANSIKDVWDMVYDVHKLGSNLSSKQNYFSNKYVSVNTVKQFYGTEQNFVSAVINRSELEKPLALDKILTNKKLADSDLQEYIIKQYNLTPNQLTTLPENKLTQILKEITLKTKASARQIARITSLPLRLLWKVTKGVQND